MTRYWTCHWQFALWRNDINQERSPLFYAGSNRFRERGVEAGDRVFIVSLSGGHLYLGGRMTVDRIVSRAEAVRITRERNLYDASEWIIGSPENGTGLDLHRRLAPELTHQIRFVSPSGAMKPPFFVSATALDVQATRGVRNITEETAQLFERIIASTDHRHRSGRVVTVTQALLTDTSTPSADTVTLPGEFASDGKFPAGSVTRVLVNRYERDAAARRLCLEHHGTNCIVCGFDFGDRYGDLAEGFIHVHHLRPLSRLGANYRIDPVNDLAPVCPNCHAAAHQEDPPVPIERLRQFWQR